MNVSTDKIDVLTTALRDLEGLLARIQLSTDHLPRRSTDTVRCIRNDLRDIDAEVHRIRRLLLCALVDQRPEQASN